MEGYPFNPCLTEAQYKEMEEKVSSTLSGLEGELKGAFYPLTGMTKEVQQKLIDDHFLFKEGDRFLQVSSSSARQNTSYLARLHKLDTQSTCTIAL